MEYFRPDKIIFRYISLTNIGNNSLSEIAYFVLSLILVIIFSWASFFYQSATFVWGSDFWEHSAAINSWLKDIWHPSTPHLGGSEGSPRFIPFYFIITIISQTLGLNTFQALGLAGIINIILFLGGIWLFANSYFRNRWAPLILLIVLTCGWGVGFNWSNVYQLRNILYVLAFPSFFVFSLSFIVYWKIIITLQSDNISIWNYILIIISISLLFCNHQLTGAASIGAIILLVIFGNSISLERRLYLLFSVIFGLIIVEIWPYFSSWEIALGLSGNNSGSWINNIETTTLDRARHLYWTNIFYQPSQVLITLGPAILGIPAIIFFIRKKQQYFIIIGMIGTIFPYLVNAFIEIPLGHRFLLYSIFFMHLSLTWMILSLFKENNWFFISRSVQKFACITLMSTMIILNISLLLAEFQGYHVKSDLSINNIARNRNNPKDYMEVLEKYISEKDVILSPAILSWPIGSYKGSVVSLYHNNPLVHDMKERKEKVHEFFEGHTNIKNRRQILDRYHVSHIFYNPLNLSTSVLKFIEILPGQRFDILDYKLIKLEGKM